MTSSARLHREQEFHDCQARARWESWGGQERALLLDEEAYLEHEPWIRPALAWLGDVRGAVALDLGCGHGMAAVMLARRGARVTGLDLSGGYLKEARARARVNGSAVSWVKASGEELPFADGTFASIWGNAILHHLDLHRAAPELYRVLRPGGVGVFCEPWGENPLLAWARRRLPYRGKQRTADEEPLTSRQLAPLAEVFPDLQMRGFQLLGMAGKILGLGRLQRTLDWCDARLLARFPGIQRLCRYLVLRVRKPLEVGVLPLGDSL